MKFAHELSVNKYTPDAGFILHYQKLVKDVMLPYQYRVMQDLVEGVEKSHVFANFRLAGEVLRKKSIQDTFGGMVFQDSDAYKWLEAAAYAMVLFPDEQLKKDADSLIALIGDAQDADGYLNTYYTIKDRDKRWTNLTEGHELYCAGHMMEAGVAYYEATGDRTLLEICERNMEHIYDVFITKKHEGCPGHPEVELALLRLYRATKNPHALELAKHFLMVRGTDPQFFANEAKSRNWTVWGDDGRETQYRQADVPVYELSKATGHAVRAVYLYTAMADLASEIGDEALLAACERIWNNITECQMYVTGGIGSTGIGEAFTLDYDLPNDTAYAETCASCGLIFYAARMLERDIDGRYADVMERALYNTVLAGVSLDGQRFFYVNPLEVIPGITGEAVTHRHDLPQRPGWYACACCPPNVARTITGIAQYAYSSNETTAFCHLYAAGTVDFDNGMKVHCTTKYPYGFSILYEVIEGNGELAIRIPGWCEQYRIQYQKGPGEPLTEIRPSLSKGYIHLHDVREGDGIVITLEDKPYYVYANSKVIENTGCAAVMRGPLVYCFEGMDNEQDILSLSIDTEAAIVVGNFDKKILGGTTELHVKAYREGPMEHLYSRVRPAKSPCMAHAVPYYTWGNRGLNQMRVWMPQGKREEL